MCFIQIDVELRKAKPFNIWKSDQCSCGTKGREREREREGDAESECEIELNWVKVLLQNNSKITIIWN